MSRVLTFDRWLNEDVEYHKELSPKFWEGTKFNPEVRQKLLRISHDFWEALKLNIKIIDIELTGSLANYNYTRVSDLDVHVIIDFSQVNDNIDLVRKALDGQRFMWNQRHNVKIGGHDVECYVQHYKEQHIASGLFSLLKNKWITTPSWNPPNIDERDVNEKVRVFKSELKEIKGRLKDAQGKEAEMLYAYLDRFKKKMMTDRKEGLAREGEFSIENLVFKELRRDGTVEDLIKTISIAYTKIYEE